MKYRRAFSLRLRHAFRADGRCTDFAVEPTPATSRAVRNHRWIWRALPDGVEVLASLGVDAKPILPLAEETRFVFQLRLLNADFPLFTALAGGNGLAGRARVFTHAGAGASTVLAERTRTASQSESFEFPARAEEGRFVLGGMPLPGTREVDLKVTGLGASARVAFEQKSRGLRVTAGAVPQARAFTVTYPVAPHWPAGVFAEVEIVMPAAAEVPAAGGPEYLIEFDALAAPWKYYLVTDVPPAKDTFAIETPGALKFNRSAADPGDPLARTLLDQFPAAGGFRVSCFVSDGPIPCRERGASGLKLKQGDATVVGALPTPPLRNLCMVGGQQGFFHILERMAKP